jgi:hypothetical protein
MFKKWSHDSASYQRPSWMPYSNLDASVSKGNLTALQDMLSDVPLGSGGKRGGDPKERTGRVVVGYWSTTHTF